MEIRQIGFTRFSRFGANLGRIHVTAATHIEGLDGTDTLEITCTEDLIKNEYIVWMDRRGVWHEHIVDSTDRTHDATGNPLTVATCINSINETWDDYITDVRPSGSVQTALESILTPTRWGAGICTQTGEASHTFYHKSVRECLQELVDTWGGELETAISCDGSKITSRKVQVMAERGNPLSHKRFTWTKDLVTITRTEGSDNPKSRIYAYGKGEATEAGGYGRRIGIESVNGGRPYVEDAAATQLWGHPMPNGTIAPACGVFIDEECEDPSILLAEALSALDSAKVLKVSYTADVLDLASFGRDWEDVSLGDTVAIIDKEFSEEGIRLRGRVSRLERDLLTYDTTITFGNLIDTMTDLWEGMQERLASITQRTVNWDLAGEASPNWLELLFSSLNARYDQVGTYHYSSFEQGEIWSNVPLDEDGHATQPGGWAMNINGLGFRLASSLNADGSWNWRAFGNGEGFSADEMNTGTLKAILIRDLSNNGNFWNLKTGDFQLAATARIGTKTVQQVVNGIDATITDTDMEYAQGTSSTQAPTTGWQTQPPAWESGKYIWQRLKTTTASGVSYSDPVMISGRDGVDGTSVSILGSYDTEAQLRAAHPTGNDGDAYIVAGDLYVWNGSDWEDVGQIQGPQGPAGTSVTVSSIQYGISASASTSPSNWVTTPPTSISEGSWLWVKTTYSNGSTATTKSYIGTDGEDGKSVYVQSSTKVGDTTTIKLTDGTTVTTITIKDGEDGATGQQGPAGENGESNYIHTAWANTPDGSGPSFSTTDSTDKSYLGVCTDSNTADPTTPSSYSWSKIEGNAGADGVGIKSIKEQFARSTSTTAPAKTSTAWSDDQPSYSSGYYYFSRSKIEWNDGKIDYTDGILARAITSANQNASSALAKATTNETTLNTLNTQEGIFNKLTNNGALQGLYMSNSQLYINGTYMKIGKISSANGRVYFDLDNNELRCDKLVSTDSTNNVIAQIGKVSLSGGGSSTRTYTGQLVYSGSDQTNGILLHPGSSSAVPTITSPSNRIRIECIANQGGGYGYGYPGIIVTKNGYTVVHGATTSLSESSAVSSTSNNNAGRVICHPAYTGSSSYTMDGKVEINGSLTATRFPTRLSSLTVTGAKSRSARTDNYGDRLLYCDETPSPTFTDFGGGRTDEDGLCYVEIDGIFAETVRTDMAYQVFLQACGEGDLWVEGKTPTYFIVHGTPNLAFDWQLKARQKDYETMRLEDEGIDDALADGADFFAGSMEAAMLADLGSIIESIEDAYETEEADEAA